MPPTSNDPSPLDGAAPHDRPDLPFRVIATSSIGWKSTLPLATALVLGFGFLYVVRVVVRPLALLVIAIAIAEALEAPVRSLQRWMTRRHAIALVYIIVVSLLGAAGLVVVPALVDQAREVIARAPMLASTAQDWLDRWGRMTGESSAGLPAQLLTRATTWLVALPLRVLSGITYTMLVLFLSAYWLLGATGLRRFILSLVPDSRRERFGETLHEAGQAMGGYVRGAAINAIIMGALAWIGLTLIGVDYAVVLGVLTMLGEPIPIVGPVLVAIPVVGVALLQSPTTALLALVLFTVLQQLEGQILTPVIMRRQTDVPQTLVLFAVVAGGLTGGVLGVLAAIPLVAALRVVALRAVVPAVRSWTGAR